jgi:hypothetical protein
MLVQARRDTQAALRVMRKLLKNRASHRSCWSPTNWAPTGRLSGNSAPVCPHERGLRSRVDDWRGILKF